MKNSKILIKFLLLITISTFSQAQENKEVDTDQKAKKKSLTESEYTAVDRFGKIEKSKLEKTYVSKFNEKGNITEGEIYKSNNILTRKTIFKYNDEDKLVEKNSYNSEGNLSKKEIMRYDSDGHRIEEATYKSANELKQKLTWKYNQKGHKIEAKQYDSEGNLSYYSVFKRDDTGQIIETNIYDSKDIIMQKHTYKFDNKGNEIEHNYYKKGKLYLTFNNTYNEKGKKTGVLCYSPNDSFYNNTVTEFDEHGNKIKVTTYKIDGSIEEKQTYEYEYDEKGNWIKRIDYKNDFPETIWEREYEYYD